MSHRSPVSPTARSFTLLLALTGLAGPAPAEAQGFILGKEPSICQGLAVSAAVETEAGLQLELVSESVGPDGFPAIDRLPLPIPSELNLCNNPGHAARIWVEGPGWWSPRAQVLIRKGAERIELVVYPTGELSGRLAAAAANTAGGTASLRFEQAAGAATAHPVPPSSTTCALKGKSFRCVLPAQTLDVVLEVEGFEPRRFPALDVGRGANRDLGEVALQPATKGEERPPAA